MTFTVTAGDNNFEGTLFGGMNKLVSLKYFDVRKSRLYPPMVDNTIILLIRISNLMQEITT